MIVKKSFFGYNIIRNNYNNMKKTIFPESHPEVTEENDFEKISESQEKANEKPKSEPEIEPAETLPEQFLEQKVDTLKDFLDVLKNNYDLTDDANLKRLLAHQILKIEMALNSVDLPLAAERIKVRNTPEGVLGYYETETGNITIDEAILQDFNTEQRLIKHVLVHESLHKEGVADEGMVELMVKKLISPMPGIYKGEQAQAKATFFTTGLDKALELYNIDNPQKLVRYYLEVELEKKWQERLKQRFFKKRKIPQKKERKILATIAKSEIESLEKDFERGVARLYEKLKKLGFNFKKNSLEILEKFID